MALPLLLCGPILRRVEPTLASVWVALREPATVALRLWEGRVAAGAGNMLLSSEPAGTRTLRVGAQRAFRVLRMAGVAQQLEREHDPVERVHGVGRQGAAALGPDPAG